MVHAFRHGRETRRRRLARFYSRHMMFPTFVVLEPIRVRPQARCTHRLLGSSYCFTPGVEVPDSGGSSAVAGSEHDEHSVASPDLRTGVSVLATDRVTADWASAWLDAHPEITLLPPERAREAGVLLYLATRPEEQSVELLRRYSGDAALCNLPKVLVAPGISDRFLLEAVGHGVVSFLDYTSVSLSDVTEALIEANQGGSRLPGVLTRALTDAIREQQRDSTAIARRSGLEPREIEVLRMLAEGHDVREIAARLRYSESTVKAITHGVVKRLGLRNRIEAVAYGVRVGAY